MDRCQSTAQKAHPELKKYGELDVPASFQAMSPRAAQLASKHIRNVSETEYLAYHDEGLLGPLEETADLLYEIYALHAAAQNLIDPARTERWVQIIRGNPERPPFAVFWHHVQESINDEAVQRFQKIAHIPDYKRARAILALLEVKFALHQELNPNFDPLGDTRRNVLDEVDELAEHLPSDSPWLDTLREIQDYYGEVPLADLVKPAVFLPHLQDTRLSLQALVRDELGRGVQHGQHLMQYAFLKQLGRQELDYGNEDIREIRDAAVKRRTIKRIHKFVELRLEASLLKDAGVHPQAADAEPPRKPNDADYEVGGRLSLLG